MSKMNRGNPRSTPRALASSEKSGGAAPLLAAAAASLLGNGGGKWSDGIPGRSNISPSPFGPVGDRILRGQRFDLRLRIAEVLQRAERDQVHRVAGRADLLVDFQPALQLRPVVAAQRTGERPRFLLRLLDREMRRLGLVVSLFLGNSATGSGDRHHHPGNGKASENRPHMHHVLPDSQGWLSRAYRVPPGHRRDDGRRRGPFFSSTASVIEFGILRGVSISPSSGMMTRKKAK